MKICIPVTSNEGLESPIAQNPRNAPFFLIKDLRYQGFSIQSRDEFLGEGTDLLERLKNQEIKAILSPSMNTMALKVWQDQGFEVFTIPATIAKDGISSYLIGMLRRMSSADTVGNSCSGTCNSCKVEGCSSTPEEHQEAL